MIVLTGAFFFETVCMMIKYKSLTDKSDKISALPKDTFKKTTKTTTTNSHGMTTTTEKYVEKANNDVIDEDLDDGIGFLSFYLFL